MMTEVGSRKIDSINKTIEGLRHNGNSLKEIEKNFNNYIKTFDDIFDDDEKTVEIWSKLQILGLIKINQFMIFWNLSHLFYLAFNQIIIFFWKKDSVLQENFSSLF